MKQIKVECTQERNTSYNFTVGKIYNAILLNHRSNASIIIITDDNNYDQTIYYWNLLPNNSSGTYFKELTEETILEKWCVRGPINDIGFGNFKHINTWTGWNNVYYFLNNGIIENRHLIPDGYTEITKEQYKKLVQDSLKDLKDYKPVFGNVAIEEQSSFSKQQKEEIQQMINDKLKQLC